MGLFVKRTEIGNNAPLYTFGSHKTLLVIGLGNIGKEYRDTRHNIGFVCIDAFAASQDFPAWIDKKDLKCQLTKQTVGDTNVILIKPTTYMNNSGEAMQAVQRFFKLTNAQTLVIHDELDIPFGQIRTRVGGGTAGHNGVKSLVQYSGEDFGRIRIGVQNEHASLTDSADFVLAKFNKNEQQSLPQLIREVSALVSAYTASGSLPQETRSFL